MTIYGYHFLTDEGVTKYGGLKPDVGVTFFAPTNELMKGMHGSHTLLGAARYAPGWCLEYCEYAEPVQSDFFQFASTTRKTVWIAPAERVHRAFALAALRVCIDAPLAFRDSPYVKTIRAYGRTLAEVGELLIDGRSQDRLRDAQMFGVMYQGYVTALEIVERNSAALGIHDVPHLFMPVVFQAMEAVTRGMVKQQLTSVYREHEVLTLLGVHSQRPTSVMYALERLDSIAGAGFTSFSSMFEFIVRDLLDRDRRTVTK